MDRPSVAPPASARPALPPAGPRFQFGFLHRGEQAVYLKCARRRFGLGMALTPIASVALVFAVASGAHGGVVAGFAVALLVCVWSLLSGPRTVLDEARGWIWTVTGEPIRE